MTTLTIDCDNNITAFASLKEAKAADIAGAEYFSSQEELAQLAASWPVAGARGKSKLLELWNSLPGVTSRLNTVEKTLAALSRMASRILSLVIVRSLRVAGGPAPHPSAPA